MVNDRKEQKMISIAGLDKAQVLKALYDRANPGTPESMGWLHYQWRDMTIEEARGLVEQGLKFEYLAGRSLKVNLTGDEFDPFWYDRAYGEGAAQAIIQALRGSEE
jgi:hypothetical protein